MVSSDPPLRSLALQGDLLQPDRDYLLVTQDQEESRSPVLVPAGAGHDIGGIWAEVLAAGPGRPTQDGTLLEQHIEPGDRVLLAPTRGAYLPLKVRRGADELEVMLAPAYQVVARRAKGCPADVRWSVPSGAQAG